MNTCLKKVVVVSLCAMQLFSDTQTVIVNFDNGSKSVSFSDGQTWHDINKEIHEKGFIPKTDINRQTCFCLTHADDENDKLLTICGNEHTSDSTWWDKKVTTTLNSKKLQDYKSSDIKVTATSLQDNFTKTVPLTDESDTRVDKITLMFGEARHKSGDIANDIQTLIEELPNKTLLGRNCNSMNFTNANLNQAQLMHATFNYATLNKTQLSHANLEDATLSFADLRHANLTEANLEYAVLVKASLENADLTGAILIKATLDNAVLRNANFSDANLTDASLKDADLNGVIFNKNTILKGTKFINVTGLSPENKTYAVEHGAIFNI